MIADAVKYAKKCKTCQIHAYFIHQPPELLHLIVTSWPFEPWRIDVKGPISPSSMKDHRFILVITDYFSKWADAILLKSKLSTWLTSLNTMSFIDLVSPGGLFMTTVPNLQAKYSISSAISTKFRMWLQPLITLLQQFSGSIQ